MMRTLAFALALAACAGGDGPPGPAGPRGAPGPAGPPGAAGECVCDLEVAERRAELELEPGQAGDVVAWCGEDELLAGGGCDWGGAYPDASAPAELDDARGWRCGGVSNGPEVAAVVALAVCLGVPP
jgi:hypothetical protein